MPYVRRVRLQPPPLFCCVASKRVVTDRIGSAGAAALTRAAALLKLRVEHYTVENDVRGSNLEMVYNVRDAI